MLPFGLDSEIERETTPSAPPNVPSSVYCCSAVPAGRCSTKTKPAHPVRRQNASRQSSRYTNISHRYKILWVLRCSCLALKSTKFKGDFSDSSDAALLACYIKDLPVKHDWEWVQQNPNKPQPHSQKHFKSWYFSAVNVILQFNSQCLGKMYDTAAK